MRGGFATHVSIAPLRFLACLSKQNGTLRVASTADQLASHAVPANERELARLFGGRTGDDKFERCEWIAAGDGTPLLGRGVQGSCEYRGSPGRRRVSQATPWGSEDVSKNDRGRRGHA